MAGAATHGLALSASICAADVAPAQCMNARLHVCHTFASLWVMPTILLVPCLHCWRLHDKLRGRARHGLPSQGPMHLLPSSRWLSRFFVPSAGMSPATCKASVPSIPCSCFSQPAADHTACGCIVQELRNVFLSTISSRLAQPGLPEEEYLTCIEELRTLLMPRSQFDVFHNHGWLVKSITQVRGVRGVWYYGCSWSCCMSYNCI